MTEDAVRNPLAIRRLIFEVYRKVQTQIATNPKSWRKLSFEAHKELCKVLGDYFIDYPEFEFWFSRFLQGNFELDYDRSLDPKTRSFTDLPVEIFEKIGYSLNLKERFALRNVSKDIQEFVDNWIPRVTDMEVWDSWRIKESFVPSQQVEHYENYADNVMSLFKNPKLRLDTLTIFGVNDKSKNIFRILERSIFNHKIHVKHFDIRCASFHITTTVLNMLDPETLEEVTLFIDRESVRKLDEFLSSEHLKRIKMFNIRTYLCPSNFPLGTFQNLPRLAITCYGHCTGSNVSDFIKDLVNSTQLQICQLYCRHYRLNMELLMREFQSPETMVPGFPDLRHFPIPGSNEFYEIEFGSNGRIRIERIL